MNAKPFYLSVTAKFFITVAAVVITLWGIREGADMINALILGAIIVVSFMPVLNWLKAKGVPVIIAYILTLLAILTVLVLLFAFLVVAVNRLVESIPTYTAELEESLAELSQSLSSLNITQTDAGALIDFIEPGQILDYVASFLAGLVGAVSDVALIGLIVIFLLVDALSVPKKLAPYLGRGNLPIDRFSSFGVDIRRYVGITTIVGLVTGFFDTILFVIMGVDFPVLWGVFAFLLSYIPTLGFWIALIPPVILAFLESGWTAAVVVFLGIVIINGFAENVVKPKYMGEGLDLSPFTVVFSVIFWSAILGPLGAILSVPVTMAFRSMILQPDPDNRWLADLISAGGNLGQAPTTVPTEAVASDQAPPPEPATKPDG